MAFECRLLGVVRLSIIGRFVFLESAIFRRFVWDFSEIWICGLYMNCTFVDNNRIEIDNNVLIASNVQIYTATHSTNVKERTMQNWDESKAICNTFALPIKIEDNVWIGGGAIILPGVTIGRNSVIGAGSVVTRSIPADCVAVGNPCRVIKHMNNEPD